MLRASRRLDLDVRRLVFDLELLELLVLLVLLLVADGGRGSQMHPAGHARIRVVRVDHLVAALAIKWLLSLLNIVMLFLFLPTLQASRVLLLPVRHGPATTHIQTGARVLPKRLCLLLRLLSSITTCIACLPPRVYFATICLALVLLDHARGCRVGKGALRRFTQMMVIDCIMFDIIAFGIGAV